MAESFCDGGFNVSMIYTELQDISDKLKAERDVLAQRECDLSQREEMLSVSQSNLEIATELTIKQQFDKIQKKHNTEISRLEDLLNEKTKENRRILQNFETLKEANDVLKKELEIVQNAHSKLEKQSQTLQSRMTNLQRKHEFNQRQKDVASSLASITCSDDTKLSKNRTDTAGIKTTKATKQISVDAFEILAILLDWVSERHLRTAVVKQKLPHIDDNVEKCVKCLPFLVNIIRDLPAVCTPRIYMPSLQFIYWSLLLMEQSKTIRSGLVSTLRRLGDELYRCSSSRVNDPTAGGDILNNQKLFFLSTDLHIRFLSSLIILKTLSQADVLAQVFETLRIDIKHGLCKELFLYYQATAIFLPFLRPIHKVFSGSAADIYLHMAGDTPFLQDFLMSCSNEVWFRSVAISLRSPAINLNTVEKLSLVLQKLSQIKSNKKYFEVYTITTAIHELLRTTARDQPYLTVNLKAILTNLNE